MKPLLASNLMLLFCLSLNAQIILPDDFTYRANLVLNQENKPLGTGFFIRDESDVYFCTAYHVVAIQEKEKDEILFPFEKIIVQYYSSDDKHGKIEINLVQSNLFDCVKADSKHDVIIVKIAEFVGDTNKKTGLMLKTLDYVRLIDVATISGMDIKKDIISEKDIVLSSDIYMLGYPAALDLSPGQLDFNYPLIKRGIVSGINHINHTIVIDCMVHKGNSGSPVFIIEGTNIKLIGLASQFVPYVNVTFKNKQQQPESLGNSGYGIVRSVDYIEKLIKEFG